MSTAGKQDKDDVRNYLVTYALNTIIELMPKYVLLENVPQQLKTKISVNGEKLLIPDYIKNTLSPYYTINSEVVNALDYGVPQMRQRSIYLMVRKDLNISWNFLSNEQREAHKTLKDAIGYLPSLDPKIQGFSDEELKCYFPQYEEKRIAGQKVSKWHFPPTHKLRHVEVMKYTPEGASALDNVIHYPKNPDGTKVKGYSNTYKRQWWDKPGYTITTYNGAVCSHDNVHPGRYIGVDVNGESIFSDARVLSCDFDELSENNTFNQIIKATVGLLLKESAVRESTKISLKKEMIFFNSVDEINPNLIRWDQLRFDRNNQGYRMIISVCQLVLQGLVLTTDSGDVKLSHFLDEQRMCRLYEKFILEFYRKEMPDIKANASKIEWQLDNGVSSLLPTMQSDIMLTKADKTLIIDAKYYSKTTQNQFGKATLHSSNIYQIFAYVKNQDVGNTGKVAGMLLYAKTDEEITPDMEVVMSGNRISAKTLDLNCDFKLIRQQLIDIAVKYL